MRRVIGLDFGSSQSMVAVMEIGSPQTPEILMVDEHEDVSRTLLALDKGDNYIISAGNKVQDMMQERGGKDFYVARNFKRYLGAEIPAEEGESAGTKAEVLCKAFLDHLNKKLCDYFNVESLAKKDFATCIAYPATWNENTVKQLVEIVKEAGFPDVHAIAEPLAAVYAVKNQREEFFADTAENYLVVDFGGGTLDVCVVEMGILGRFAKVVSRSGNPQLGGHEFDNIIQTQYFRRANLRVSNLPARQKAIIKNDCEKNKRDVSRNMANGAPDYICSFDTPSFFELKITREDMLNWCTDSGILKKYRECIEDALNKAGLDISMISRVVLTGGTSQWWFLKEVFTSPEEGYGMDEDKVIMTNRPHADVCIGCAIHAGYAENQKLEPGIWIKYRVGKFKNPDEGWGELKQLRAPAFPGKQASHERTFLVKLTKSKLLSSYRIEFKWYKGISESSLELDSPDTGIVELYARSNIGFIKSIATPVILAAKMISQAGGLEVKAIADSYKLYMQMDESESFTKYELLMQDVKEQAREIVRRNKNQGEEEANKLPAGKSTKCEVQPGKISRWNWLGWGKRVIIDKN